MSVHLFSPVFPGLLYRILVLLPVFFNHYYIITVIYTAFYFSRLSTACVMCLAHILFLQCFDTVGWVI